MLEEDTKFATGLMEMQEGFYRRPPLVDADYSGNGQSLAGNG
ncbi:MAG: hypothetical protein Q7T33_12950 [Dehalococcoidia bacterium]|nr:hypothetical protein [Dehalococcoidia bacterium]